MRHKYSLVVLFVFALFVSCYSQENNKVKHVEVYSEPDMFGGWPANHGIWIWGNEILVGFGKGYHKNLGEFRHSIDREKPEVHMFARSLDGGETWSIEDPSKKGVIIARGEALHGTEPDPENMKPITRLPKPMDFSKPGFALKFWMLNHNQGPSIFYYSYDKGHNWNGPYSLTVGDNKNISARVDYIVEDHNSCLAFFTAAKKNMREGKVVAARTDDGGLSWQLLADVGGEPENGFRIMPSTVKLKDNQLLLTARVRSEAQNWSELSPQEQLNSRYIDAWISKDNGKSWDFAGKPVPGLGEGNPPCLIKLKDGRLCLTYGHRAKPFGIVAKISEDNGKTWGKDIALRSDGAGRDVGYVRSVQRPDGKVVSIYYFMDKHKKERYIAGTIWNPSDY